MAPLPVTFNIGSNMLVNQLLLLDVLGANYKNTDYVNVIF